MFRFISLILILLVLVSGCTDERIEGKDETTRTAYVTEVIESVSDISTEDIEPTQSSETTELITTIEENLEFAEGDLDNMDRIASFLMTNKNVQMATVGLDGKPSIRTIWFQFYENGRLYFQTDVEASLYKDIIQSPYIEFVAANIDYTQTLRVKGEVVIEDNAELVERVLTTYPIIKKHYDNIGNPPLMMFYLNHGTASIFEFSEERQETILFYEW